VHPNAALSAEAAEAADRQGALWPMHDLLLEHQQELQAVDLVGYAADLRPDVDRFREDLAAMSAPTGWRRSLCPESVGRGQPPTWPRSRKRSTWRQLPGQQRLTPPKALAIRLLIAVQAQQTGAARRDVDDYPGT